MNFKSKLEECVYGILNRWRGQYKVSYESERLPYTLQKTYVPDFIITRPDGSKFYIEAKGYLRPENRTQLLSVRINNPGIDLRIIFQKDNKLNARSRTYYSDWAKKNNFLYSIGSVPKDWMK